MKKNRTFLIVMLTVVLVILAACESSDKQSTTISDEPEINNVSEDTGESKDSLDVDTEISEENENEEQDEVADQTVIIEEKSTENNNGNNQTVAEKNENEKNLSEPSENIQITSGEEAIQYLKQHIKEGTNGDVSFGATETLAIDDNGSYYTVRLVDIPLRVAGRTGTLDTYKVYQDGTYELYQLKSSNSDSEIAKNYKEEYLKKLNDIEKEMEELRKNSEATTTLDMEEEEAYRYKIWDVELNEIYGVLKEQLGKEQMDKLREEQRNWIKHRDETAKEASLKYKGGSMESLEYVATQATLTKERCYALVAKYME